MILNIIPPASMLAALGAEPGDRLLVDDLGQWRLCTQVFDDGHPRLRIKRILDDSEVEVLRVTAEDCKCGFGLPVTGPASAQLARIDRGMAVSLADEWLHYGITRPDFLRWTSRGIFEPSVAADLYAAGCDPDLQRDLLGEHSEALNDGDMSVAEFMRLVNRE